MMWEEVGGAVLANVHKNKNFTALPVDQPTLQAALTDFTASIAATVQGGSQATNEKNKKKHELVALLRKLGLYVQANSNEDAAILMSSGFHAASRDTHSRSFTEGGYCRRGKGALIMQTNRFERSGYLAAKTRSAQLAGFPQWPNSYPVHSTGKAYSRANEAPVLLHSTPFFTGCFWNAPFCSSAVKICSASSIDTPMITLYSFVVRVG